MASSSLLLSLPPEVISNILFFLPIQSLLRFSQTNRYSHSLAVSNLHTLSLGIYTTRIAAIISCLSATKYPEPKLTTSSFPSSIGCSSEVTNTKRDKEPNLEPKEHFGTRGPYSVAIVLQEAQWLDATTLLLFHNALMKSVIIRHRTALRNVELSLWTLTVPIAKSLSALQGLRTLSIRIEAFPQVRGMRGGLAVSQRLEQREAWNILTADAVWAPRLHALRLEGGEITSTQVSRLLRRSRWCRELWLSKCALVDKGIWSFLANEWATANASLRILGIMECGGQLDEEVLELIDRLEGLQFLFLQGVASYNVSSEVVAQRNETYWRIPEFIPPVSPAFMGTVIEADPLYM
ncbi:uncharacterized protein EI97DRAFT_58900 [Westerdykella ornata]|uniref:F-box domain-containing protein n=1 Tax=Westerdykella ornata TaxID=318751 RepID=A0A6A6JIF6_WESOR|nr:uncharacterized protein EI97DRAFT_58900 [Westerdykella ornata]KAF2275873.1 hypothetical protein EI97DRAFT_58900 [Westerdykella ornata]